MRRFIPLLFLLPLMTSCHKSENTIASNAAEYAEVPNWLNRTMLADLPGGGFDTVYGYTQNDLTYIRYKGIPYRIRAQKGLTDYVVSDTGHKFYVTVFNGKEQALLDCFVNPGQYLDGNRMVPQTQTFRPIQAPPFVNNRTSDYYSR